MSESVPIEGEVSAAPLAGGDGRRFDAFLSHNSRDKPLVERIAERLKRARTVRAGRDRMGRVRLDAPDPAGAKVPLLVADTEDD